MYYSKKKRAEMRKRKKKQQQKQKGDDKEGGQPIANNDYVNHVSDTSSKRKRDEDASSTSTETNIIRMPEGLTGKEARKFRKDARRKARTEGKDESCIRFVNADGTELQANSEATKTKKKKKGKSKSDDDEVEDDKDDDNFQSRPEKKRQKKTGKVKSFPRINDLIAAHEEAQKRQIEIEMRKPVPQEERERYVALDCEMVGIGAGGKQSALARVSMTGWDHDVLLDTFVQVPDRVTDFRTHVSGVRAADIKAKNDAAMELHACRRKVGEMLKGKILVGHALKNDFSALMLDHPKEDIRDTARYRPFMRPSGRGGGKMRPRKLRDLVKQHLGLDIQVQGESHCSIDDAQATMQLYQYAKEEWDNELLQKKKGGGKHRRFK